MFLNKEWIIINYFFLLKALISSVLSISQHVSAFLMQDIHSFFLNSSAMPFLVLLCVVCFIIWFLFYTSERVTGRWGGTVGSWNVNSLL